VFEDVALDKGTYGAASGESPREVGHSKWVQQSVKLGDQRQGRTGQLDAQAV
jgi:hypothetical protein